MGLTQKILLFASALVVALVATTLAFTTFQAESARPPHDQPGPQGDARGLGDLPGRPLQASSSSGIRVLGNDPDFKAAVANGEDPRCARPPSSTCCTSAARTSAADFFIATDPDGIVIARSDRPGVGRRPLEGPDSSRSRSRRRGVGHRLAPGRHAVPRGFGPDADRRRAWWACWSPATGSTRPWPGRSASSPTARSPTSCRTRASRRSSRSRRSGPKEAALKAALGAPDFAAGKGEMESFELDLARRALRRRADPPEGGERRDRWAAPSRCAAWPTEMAVLPQVPRQPDPRVAGGDGPRPGRRLSSRPGGSRARCARSSTSWRGPATARTRAR